MRCTILPLVRLGAPVIVEALATEEAEEEPTRGASVSVFELDPDPDLDADAEPEPDDREALAEALTEAGDDPEFAPEAVAVFEFESVFPILPSTSLRLSLADMIV